MLGYISVILLVLVLIFLTIAAFTSNKEDRGVSVEERVKKINEYLNKMDNAQSAEEVKCYYKSITDYMRLLPNTIMLNNMTLEQARYAVYKEYEDAIRRVNKVESQCILEQDDADVVDIGNGIVRVKWDYLNGRFMKNAALDEDLFWRYNGTDECVDIPKSKLDAMEKNRIEYMKRESAIHRTALLNNTGIELEKRGEIQEAIKIYEQNISYIDCDATLSYDRLLVLYRRQKDYENELRVCELATSKFKTIDKYKERRDKIKTLILKRNQDK